MLKRRRRFIARQFSRWGVLSECNTLRASAAPRETALTRRRGDRGVLPTIGHPHLPGIRLLLGGHLLEGGEVVLPDQGVSLATRGVVPEDGERCGKAIGDAHLRERVANDLFHPGAELRCVGSLLLHFLGGILCLRADGERVAAL